jgi:DNA-binding HxlR family transcriptional regulator
MDQLDQIILDLAYARIDAAESKRVVGSTVYADVASRYDIAPVVIPARLRRLVSLGLLERDKGNSSSRTKVYLPTEAGYKARRGGR